MGRPKRLVAKLGNTEALDAWGDYCAKSFELERLVFLAHEGPYTQAVRDEIANKRRDLDAMLDRMIANNGKP